VQADEKVTETAFPAPEANIHPPGRSRSLSDYNLWEAARRSIATVAGGTPLGYFIFARHPSCVGYRFCLVLLEVFSVGKGHGL